MSKMVEKFKSKSIGKNILLLGIFKGFAVWLLNKMLRHIKFRSRWWSRLTKMKRGLISNWLRKNYWDKGLYKTDIIREVSFEISLQREDKTPVWIFWYQGWEVAPELIVKCREQAERILSCNDNLEIHFLHKDNLTEYVRFPDWLMQKLEWGNITYTHFSDILRIALLYAYGGVWMDATIFLTKPFNKEISEKEYFSIRQKPTIRWNSFFISCKRPFTPFAEYVLVLFLEYLKQNEYFVDYYLIDIIMNLVLYHNPQIAMEWSMIPVTNQRIEDLAPLLNTPYDARNWETMNRDTGIFKLTWKGQLTDSPDSYYATVVCGR